MKSVSVVEFNWNSRVNSVSVMRESLPTFHRSDSVMEINSSGSRIAAVGTNCPQNNCLSAINLDATVITPHLTPLFLFLIEVPALSADFSARFGDRDRESTEIPKNKALRAVCERHNF